MSSKVGNLTRRRLEFALNTARIIDRKGKNGDREVDKKV